MYHTNCDDAQTDQSLFWSYFPQMNISGKQNQSQKRCEARDVSNAQTDVSLRHSHVHDPDHTACVIQKLSV